MGLPEYIAAGLKRGGGEDFGDLLEAAGEMAGLEVRKVAPHYVIFTATAADGETLGRRFAHKYKISPNSELKFSD